ncbi:transglutaminase family protein [Sphingomonas oryzagri]
MGGVTDTIAYLGLVEDEDIRIEIAALELSALDHPGVDLEPYLAILSDMEERLAATGGDAIDGGEQARALAQVIAADYGFVGDRDGYDAPVNADMIRVIDRRKGLPVSLSILYAGLARRLGWLAEALDTPRHVVVALAPSDAPQIIDPFSRGRILTPGQLLALIGHATGTAGSPNEIHLMAMTNRMTLTRLLLNQAMRAETARSLTRLSPLRADHHRRAGGRQRLVGACAPAARRRRSRGRTVEPVVDARDGT